MGRKELFSDYGRPQLNREKPWKSYGPDFLRREEQGPSKPAGVKMAMTPGPEEAGAAGVMDTRLKSKSFDDYLHGSTSGTTTPEPNLHALNAARSVSLTWLLASRSTHPHVVVTGARPVPL